MDTRTRRLSSLAREYRGPTISCEEEYLVEGKVLYRGFEFSGEDLSGLGVVRRRKKYADDLMER